MLGCLFWIYQRLLCMISTTIISNRNTTKKLNYCFWIQIVFVMKFETEDAYKDFWNDKDSPFYDNSNKKVIGKFKGEAAGTPTVEFVGLR